MYPDHPTDRRTIGQTHTSTWVCPCGDTFTQEATRVPSPFNPALATSIVSWDDFRRGRVWFPEHRPHGKPVQL